MDPPESRGDIGCDADAGEVESSPWFLSSARGPAGRREEAIPEFLAGKFNIVEFLFIIQYCDL